MSKVGFIGLGAMGSRMTANLLKAGHDVSVCDRSPHAVRQLVEVGARAAASAREAAQGNELVLAMVRDDEISRNTWLDVTNGALLGMESGAIALECSTITPAWALELGEAMTKAGIAMLEAPVSGSTPQAENAQLIFLVGGTPETLKQAESLLTSMGSRVQHAGPTGSGALAKLVTNSLKGAQLSTIAEMIGMLKRQGVDPSKILNSVAATRLWCPHLTSDSESMFSADFASRFPIKLLLKDLNYTVMTAGGDGSVPTVSAVRGVFQRAMDEQLGDLDMTAVVKLFEDTARH